MKNKYISIIDYRLSNIYSVKHACEAVGLNAIISSKKEDLLSADGAILPGVGAFGDAMSNLKKLDLISPIKDFIANGKPFMGICLGMQLLFTESSEFGIHKGLDVIEGTVNKFPEFNKHNKIRIPHVGWNKIYLPKGRTSWKNSLLRGVDNNDYMYFVHSYYVSPSNYKDVLAMTDYEGVEYCSAIVDNNVFATQFHPEKSGRIGLKIYQNFVEKIL